MLVIFGCRLLVLGELNIQYKQNKWDFFSPDSKNLWKSKPKLLYRGIEKKSGYEFWIISNTLGLGILDILSGKLTFLESDSENVRSVSGNRSYKMYKDDLDRLWIFHLNGHIDSFDPRHQFANYLSFYNDECSGSEFVYPKMTDGVFNPCNDKVYFVNEGCTGFFEIDSSLSQVKPIISEGFNREILSRRAIIVDQACTIWIGGLSSEQPITKNKYSLFNYHPEWNEAKPLVNDLTTQFNIHSKEITALYENTQEEIWIGTGEGELIRFRENGEIYFLKGYLDSLYAEKRESYKYGIRELKEDSTGYLWIAADQPSLLYFDPVKNEFHEPTLDSIHLLSHPEIRIHSIALQGDNLIWAAANQRLILIRSKEDGDSLRLTNKK